MRIRVHLAILFSLLCGAAIADDESVKVTSSTVNLMPVQPVAIGRPHVCSNNYPIAAMQAHAEGTTMLAFTITTEGTVKDIKVAKSSNSRDLDDAAVRCATDWQYKPAMKDGKPVEKPWQVNVVWKIPDSAEMLRAVQCLKYRPDVSLLPQGSGTSSLTFRVMPDGSMRDVAISHSSGDKSLDDAALHCVAAGHFDASLVTLPSEGVPGRVDIEWGLLAALPPNYTPPQRIADPASKN